MFQLYPALLQHEEVLLYLRKVCQLSSPLPTHNHLTRFENQLQYQLLRMAKMKVDASVKISVIDVWQARCLSVGLFFQGILAKYKWY